jgi:hypothetical protein
MSAFYLGSLLGGLVGIDLDCPEPLLLADYFLPYTEAMFGHASKPKSHRLYTCHPLASFEKLEDPVRVEGNKLKQIEGRRHGKKKDEIGLEPTILVEYRSNQCTVSPLYP